MPDQYITIERLARGATYESGPLTSHFDVHAGGILFGFVYQEFLSFSNSHVVQRWRNVLGSFWQMDREPERFSTQQESSTYRFNERGYLEFSFPDSQYYGAVLPARSEVLAFFVSGSKGQRSYSMAYSIKHT